MSPLVLAAVMGAAALHAAWNAMLRGGADRFWSTALMMVSVAAVSTAVLAVAPSPAPASWPCIALSGLIHVAYNLSLVRLYRSGDLGQTYPISRGSSPALVALAAALFAGERLDGLAVAGVALVCGGIVSLARTRGGVRRDVVGQALVTGTLIGAYTVVDGVGVRLAGTSLGYAAWSFLLWSVPIPLIFLAVRGRPPRYTARQTAVALLGGVVSIVAYGVVIWAMQFDAMGVVSALRETSVVYAAIIGRVFLDETLTARKVCSCLAIAAGAALLVH